MTDPPDKVEFYEHFFRDPGVADGILQPPHSGIACRNIRDALRYLGDPVPAGDQYDDELKQAVLRFQNNYGHDNRDGLVGPGTRKLLTKTVVAAGDGFFKRGRISPEYAVFLSYSRKDEARLTGIIQGIKSQGIPVFHDKEAIPGGARWPDMLYRSIRKCQVFLCILSPQSAGSINVLLEVALARHAERPILPVLLEAVALPGALQALLEGIQYLDLSGRPDSQAALNDLLQALSVYLRLPNT